MNATRTRVILTGHHFFPYGFRQPGCTSKLMADCPAEHKCMDYREHKSAMERAQGYAHTHPLMERARARRLRRGLILSRHRSGEAIQDPTPAGQHIHFEVGGLPLPAIDLTHDKETRSMS